MMSLTDDSYFAILGYYLLNFKDQKIYFIISLHVLSLLSISAVWANFSICPFPPLIKKPPCARVSPVT